MTKMNAQIKVEGRRALVTGSSKLVGAKVTATDLRAGAALILAALAADGETEVSGVHHINRGYTDIVSKLSRLGAYIYAVSDDSVSDRADKRSSTDGRMVSSKYREQSPSPQPGTGNVNVQPI